MSIDPAHSLINPYLAGRDLISAARDGGPRSGSVTPGWSLQPNPRAPARTAVRRSKWRMEDLQGQSRRVKWSAAGRWPRGRRTPPSLRRLGGLRVLLDVDGGRRGGGQDLCGPGFRRVCLCRGMVWTQLRCGTCLSRQFRTVLARLIEEVTVPVGLDIGSLICTRRSLR
jgi:hypothetical protein